MTVVMHTKDKHNINYEVASHINFISSIKDVVRRFDQYYELPQWIVSDDNS